MCRAFKGTLILRYGIGAMHTTLDFIAPYQYQYQYECANMFARHLTSSFMPNRKRKEMRTYAHAFLSVFITQF